MDKAAYAIFILSAISVHTGQIAEGVNDAISVISWTAAKAAPYVSACLSLNTDLHSSVPTQAALPSVNCTLPSDDLVRLDGLASNLPPHLAEAADGLVHHLEDSVRRRVYDIPSPP